VLGLWLFAAVTLLSIALQNLYFFGFAAWLAAGFIGGWRGRSPHPALRWMLPFLAWTLLASWLGENRAHSLDTWKKWLLLAAALQASAQLNTPRRLRSVLGALFFFSALWCLGASLWSLRGPAAAWRQGMDGAALLARWVEEGAWRAVSGSGGYMVLGTGSMLLLCLGTGLLLHDAAWRRPLFYGGLAAVALALLLTQTRGAWMGAAAGVLLLLAMEKPRWAGGLLLAAGLTALLWPGNPVMERMRQGADMSRDSTRERVYMLQSGASIVRDHPWIGVGDSLESHNGVEGVYRRYETEGAKHWDSTRGQEYGHLHDNFVQLAVMYGLPGLGLMLLGMGALAAALWRRRAASPLVRAVGLGTLACLLAWWVNGLVEYNFGSFQSSFFFWFLMGTGLSSHD
jgi:O-antigen ligase